VYLRLVFLSERTRVVPVAETSGIAVGATAGSDDEGEKDDADNDDDLDGRQPELELAEELDATKVVDTEDGDDEDGLHRAKH
jgi:hypothetical protein